MQMIGVLFQSMFSFAITGAIVALLGAACFSGYLRMAILLFLPGWID